jgi:molybdenum cofactor biosynthesis protein MoaC
VASGLFFAAQATILRIREKSLPKGDVLTLAEVAGIQGAKKTADLLPLCHPLALTSVRVWTQSQPDSIQVFCEVKTFGKTGVEMEALCGAQAALLCIYDLAKGVDPVLSIGELRLEIKEGGKSGVWVNPQSKIAHTLVQNRNQAAVDLTGINAVVVTLSDRCYQKQTEDLSGPVAQKWLISHGVQVTETLVLPDDGRELEKSLERLLDFKNPNLIVTTGGTGLSHRDITPETVLDFAHEHGGREIPGLSELLRMDGAKHTHMTWLSRSTVVQIRDTLIVCLPGNPNAVTQGLDVLGPLFLHALHVSKGGKHNG